MARGPAADDERFQVVIHATPDEVAGFPSASDGLALGSRLDGAGPLPLRTLQRLGCDASVLTCLEDREGNHPEFTYRLGYVPLQPLEVPHG